MLICPIQVPHNCARNACDSSGSTPIIQERRETQLHRAIKVHYCEEDRVLNTGKMRDSNALSHFFKDPDPRPLEEVLDQAKHNQMHNPIVY
jgi:hypothetical protein